METEKETVAAPEAVAAPPRNWRRPSPTVLAIAILIAAVLAESVLLFRGNSAERTRIEVLGISRRFLTAMLTYNSATLEQQKSKVLALATGKFRNEYEQLTSSGFPSLLREKNAEARTTIDRVAVTTVLGDNASSIAEVELTITNKDLPAPRVARYLIELSLVRTSSGWRVDSVSILGSLS